MMWNDCRIALPTQTHPVSVQPSSNFNSPGPDAAAAEHHADGKPGVDSEAFWSAQYKAKNNYEL